MAFTTDSGNQWTAAPGGGGSAWLNQAAPGGEAAERRAGQADPEGMILRAGLYWWRIITMNTFLLPSRCCFGFMNLLLGSVLAASAAEPTPAPGPGTRECRIIETVTANYPIRMMENGVKYGTVEMLLKIDETGRLADVLVTTFSHKPFADEALRVVREWRFEPAIHQDRPVTTIMELKFNFEVGGILVYQVQGGPIPSLNPWLERDFEFEPQKAGKLDRRPVPVKVVPPTYPEEWAAQGLAGTVAVEFYIDGEGRVRMPVSTPGSNEQLAGIAVAAVKQWEFPPQTWQGRPVLTRARQEFQFVRQ